MSEDSCDLEGFSLPETGKCGFFLSAKMSANLHSRPVILGALALTSKNLSGDRAQPLKRNQRRKLRKKVPAVNHNTRRNERRSIEWRAH